MSGILRLRKQKANPPKRTTETFGGKTVLVTGATGGLGLEAAKKIAALDADKLIITARNAGRGQVAKRQIEDSIKDLSTGKTSSSTEVMVMSLDMNSTSSVRAFAGKICSSSVSRLDAVILNAGVSRSQWIESPEGWEEDLQVNAISTILLSLLLMPKLLETAAAHTSCGAPHLAFVSSGRAVAAQPSAVSKYYASPNALKAMSEKKNHPGGQKQYQISKLLLEYCVRHIAQLPILQGPGGTPKVIVNSVCPGLCKSELARDGLTNWFMKLLAWLFFALFARTAEQGADSYISALTRTSAGHGQLWKDDIYYDRGMMDSDEGMKRFGDEKIWKEMVDVVEKAAPKVRSVIVGQ